MTFSQQSVLAGAVGRLKAVVIILKQQDINAEVLIDAIEESIKELEEMMNEQT